MWKETFSEAGCGTSFPRPAVRIKSIRLLHCHSSLERLNRVKLEHQESHGRFSATATLRSPPQCRRGRVGRHLPSDDRRDAPLDNQRQREACSGARMYRQKGGVARPYRRAKMEIKATQRLATRSLWVASIRPEVPVSRALK